MDTKKPFIALVLFYQKYISALLGPSCRYWPTCSQYALECLHKYSCYVAIRKIVWRILRCNPYFPGGIDKP